MLRLLLLFSAGVILHTVMAEAVSAAEPAEPQQIKRYIAIDNVCAWPQLAVLRVGRRRH